MPPVSVNNQLVTNVLIKASLFNNFLDQQCNTNDNKQHSPTSWIFFRQCNTIDNGSILPRSVFKTTSRISSFDICNNEITRIIGSLNPNKTRGFDGISNFMLKLCASSISKPLPLLFKQSLEKECFPNEKKKAI